MAVLLLLKLPPLTPPSPAQALLTQVGVLVNQTTPKQEQLSPNHQVTAQVELQSYLKVVLMSQQSLHQQSLEAQTQQVLEVPHQIPQSRQLSQILKEPLRIPQGRQ